MYPNSGEAGVYDVTVIVKPYASGYDGTIFFQEYSEEPIDPPYYVLGSAEIEYRQ
jgi:hypothetical protein